MVFSIQFLINIEILSCIFNNKKTLPSPVWVCQGCKKIRARINSLPLKRVIFLPKSLFNLRQSHDITCDKLMT